MQKNHSEKTLYQRSDSPYWYYDSIDPQTGLRKRRSTHKTDYKEALEFIKDIPSNLAFSGGARRLVDLLYLYADPSMNPRRKQALLDGSHYSAGHAQHIASAARSLKKILEEHAPIYLKKKLIDFTRLDIKTIKYVIIEAKGRCRQSQSIFQALKTFLAQAADDGLIPVSPAVSIPNIQYEVKKRMAIEADKIAKLIAHPEIFLYQEDWAFFTILATTGMRMSEALALSKDQIYQGTLTINRALKSNCPDDIGLPKWDISRVIPLAKITQEAFASLVPDFRGRYFRHGRDWGSHCFSRIQAVAMAFDPPNRDMWREMTAHILRHSCNTNLLCSGIEPIFVAEYLSWGHQTLLTMQQRYTHIYAASLQCCADKIDELYNDEEEKKRIYSKNNGNALVDMKKAGIV